MRDGRAHARSGSGSNAPPLDTLLRRAWVVAYDPKRARERHATNRRYNRPAACCVALPVLQLAGR
jgi:hypothetical protein